MNWNHVFLGNCFLGIIWLSACGVHSSKSIAADKPTVSIATVKKGLLERQLTLTAEFKPYQEVEIHAKVSGYVKKMYVDVGDKLKAGQPIALLEVPEAQDELRRAQAEVVASREEIAKAEATYEEAHLGYTRLQGVVKAKPNLISQQELDTSRDQDAAAEATLAAAHAHSDESSANAKKVETMIDYESITAPFSGVVTERRADVGALVQAGTSSNTQSLPLVRFAEIDHLRLVFDVPQSAIDQIHDNDSVEVTVASTGKKFTGKIARYAHSVDVSTRTMTTEVDVDNADGALFPGIYASVNIALDKKPDALSVPLSAIFGDSKPTVYVVGPNNKIEQRAVKMGIQTANAVEIVSGLNEGEQVVVAGKRKVHEGETVTIAVNSGN
jgi:RND family efflux transporter MFP subunit